MAEVASVAWRRMAASSPRCRGVIRTASSANRSKLADGIMVARRVETERLDMIEQFEQRRMLRAADDCGALRSQAGHVVP